MNEIREQPAREYKIDQILYTIYANVKSFKQFYNIIKYLKNKDNQKILLLWDEIEKMLYNCNTVLKIINNEKNIISSDNLRVFTNNNNNVNNNIRLFCVILFNNLLYKGLIDFPNNYLIRELIIQNKKSTELTNKIRYFRLIYQKIDDIKTIDSKINEFIKNNFKEQALQSRPRPANNNNIININKPVNINFNCEIKQNEKVYINIKYWILNISIIIPYEKTYYKNKFGNIECLLNYKYDESIQEFNISKKKINFLLISKLQTIFNYRVIRIFFTILDEKKYLKENRDSLNDAILEFCKRFLYYLSDYKDIFKTKCALCGKIVKYSLQEKCFFPPYYKIYKVREFKNSAEFRDKNNTEENSKLFYHEECFAKIAHPCI